MNLIICKCDEDIDGDDESDDNDDEGEENCDEYIMISSSSPFQ